MAQILLLLWLWLWLVATAPIRLLAWEPPYATGAALEKTKRQKKKKKGIKGTSLIMPGSLIYHINIIDQSENSVLLKYLENKALVMK